MSPTRVGVFCVLREKVEGLDRAPTGARGRALAYARNGVLQVYEYTVWGKCNGKMLKSLEALKAGSRVRVRVRGMFCDRVGKRSQLLRIGLPDTAMSIVPAAAVRQWEGTTVLGGEVAFVVAGRLESVGNNGALRIRTGKATASVASRHIKWVAVEEEA